VQHPADEVNRWPRRLAKEAAKGCRVQRLDRLALKIHRLPSEVAEKLRFA
jgi:hypothetical protein